MKISHGIEYLATRLLALIFQVLPHGAAIWLGEKLGRAANNLWMTRHKVIVDNLKIAYGDSMAESARLQLSRDIFGNLGKTVVEIGRSPVYGKKWLLEMIDSEGEETFQEALDYGRGAILTGSHFGNWELMGAYINALGFPVDFLVKSQHNSYFDRYLTYLRQCLGVRVIHSEQGMKEIIRALKDNRQVAIVSDQHAGSNGIAVKFFGRLVSVPRAPATLAVKMGSPIITGHILRKPDKRHHCVFHKPVYPDPDADPADEIFRLTKLFTQRIENAIRSQPDHWLWTHRRFKYVPSGEQSEGSYVK
jgi:KDO2-lipid IV(A) lauroyltransferase